jgi:hypothetical protein
MKNAGAESVAISGLRSLPITGIQRITLRMPLQCLDRYTSYYVASFIVAEIRVPNEVASNFHCLKKGPRDILIREYEF